MTKVTKESAIVVQKEKISEDIYSIWLKNEAISKQAKAGQFVSVYCKDKSRLLPRPISICEVDSMKNAIRLVFRMVGEGTKELSQVKVSESVEIMGPLGNGFTQEEKKAILIGGGIGIPPMLQLAKELKCEKTMVLGYRNQDTFLLEEFKPYGNIVIATDDGSIGTKGNVIDAIKEHKIEADIIYACGPTPMLKGVKEYAKTYGIKAQISMEERMACGIGVCLACVCNSKEIDEHTHVNKKRICKDGPVFNAEEVEL